MLTVALPVGELACPLFDGWGCTFDVFAVVPPPPPQAATANELTASRGMAYLNLTGLIRDICCSSHCYVGGRWCCARDVVSTTCHLTLVALG